MRKNKNEQQKVLQKSTALIALLSCGHRSKYPRISRQRSRREEGKDYKGAGRNFDGNGNVNFLDCGDGFIGAYICSYLLNYNYKMKYVI